MQRVAERCIGQTADVSAYRKNRDLLYGGLRELCYSCVYPDGAFYLFVRSPEPDAKAFSERAKKYELLLVPSDDFDLPGYVRLAYCVSEATIRNSMPSFKALAEEGRKEGKAEECRNTERERKRADIAEAELEKYKKYAIAHGYKE